MGDLKDALIESLQVERSEALDCALSLSGRGPSYPYDAGMTLGFEAARLRVMMRLNHLMLIGWRTLTRRRDYGKRRATC